MSERPAQGMFKVFTHQKKWEHATEWGPPRAEVARTHLPEDKVCQQSQEAASDDHCFPSDVGRQWLHWADQRH